MFGIFSWLFSSIVEYIIYYSIGDYKKKYTKKVLFQAFNIFLNCISNNTLKNTSYFNNINSTLPNQICQYIDNKTTINNNVKICLKESMKFLYNITFPEYKNREYTNEEYKFNYFKRIIDNITNIFH